VPRAKARKRRSKGLCVQFKRTPRKSLETRVQYGNDSDRIEAMLATSRENAPPDHSQRLAAYRRLPGPVGLVGEGEHDS
jgi:hypothetical protein